MRGYEIPLFTSIRRLVREFFECLFKKPFECCCFTLVWAFALGVCGLILTLAISGGGNDNKFFIWHRGHPTSAFFVFAVGVLPFLLGIILWTPPALYLATRAIIKSVTPRKIEYRDGN